MSITKKTNEEIITAYEQIRKNRHTEDAAHLADCESVKQMVEVLLGEITNSTEYQNGETVKFSPIDFAKAIWGKTGWKDLSQYYQNSWLDFIEDCTKEYAKEKGIIDDYPDHVKGKKREFTFASSHIGSAPAEPDTVLTPEVVATEPEAAAS